MPDITASPAGAARGNAGRAGPPLCPSAPAGVPGARIIGLVGEDADGAPRVDYLGSPLPVPAGLPAALEPLAVGEVFRVAAPCAGDGCLHHAGGRCRLVDGIVSRLAVTPDTLPACSIRADCLWWRQRGREACRRCPTVVTTRRIAPPAG